MTRPLIMGILNVTPDSFSDGGRWTHLDAAVAHGVELSQQGADLVDVGGESTRPGAARVRLDEERARVLPVVRELVGRGIRVSVDTLNSSTARLSAEAGAEYINDVSGGLADPDMYAVIAETGARYIATHWRGHSSAMDAHARYDDVVVEVRGELGQRITEMLAAGIDPARIVLDPGLGFSKTAEHNWTLLRELAQLETLGYPLLIGASRKRFLGELVGEDASVENRDAPTATVSALAAQAGAWGVRVHDVPSTRAALRVWDRWSAGGTA